MRTPDALRPMLAVWAYPNYVRFMGGMTPALVTLWVQRVGTLWLAWELTRSNTWVGVIVALDYAPMLLLAPFVGAFTEKSNPVTVQKASQYASLVIAMLMALFTFAGLMNIWLLAALSLLLGCVHPFNAISRHTIVPATVPKEVIPSALATDSALYNAARFVGPALAGYVVDRFGASYTFLLNTIGIVAYLVSLCTVQISFADRTSRGRGNIVGDIVEGISYVRRHAGIGPIFMLLVIGAIWVRPLQDLLPGFADKVFGSGATGLGWLTAGMGVGAMTAAGLIAAHGRTHGLTLLVLISFIANLVTTLLFTATGYLWLGVIAGVLWGGSLTMLSTGTQALVQSSVDNAFRSRVMSLYTMIYRGVPAIGAVVIGWLADHIGLQLAFALAALICVPAWISAVRRRSSMTLALEGRHNDLDAQLVAASKELAGLGYERLVDARARLGPVATRIACHTRVVKRRTQQAISARLASRRVRRDNRL